VRTVRDLSVVGLAVAAFLTATTSAAAAAGEPDPQFSKDGKAIVGFPHHIVKNRALTALGTGNAPVVATSIRRTPDDDPSTVGDRYRDVAVARLRADGTYDRRFSRDGRAVIRIPGTDQYAADVAVQPDGKPVVVATNDGSLLVTRMTRDGSLDRAFSGDGLAEVAFTAAGGIAGVDIAPDGSVIVAGKIQVPRGGASDADFAIAKLTPSGSLDPSFSADGIATVDLASDEAASHSRDEARAVVVQPDGRIIVGGFTYPGDFPYGQTEFALVRLSATGQLDPTFAGDGTVTGDFVTEGGILDLALDAQGRLLAVGDAHNPIVARYDPDGDLDAAFAGDGTASIPFGDRDYAFGITAQPGGKPALAGVERGRDGGDFAIMRLTGAGTPDLSFAVNGLFSLDLLRRSQEHGGVPGGFDLASSIAVDAHGRLVAGGTAGGDRAAVVRLLAGR
jgi:uncharacterized delta-60 repeat protein